MTMSGFTNSPQAVASGAGESRNALGGEMRSSIIATWFVLMLAGSQTAAACTDEAYERHLSALRALVPAVTTAEPERSALARFFEALPPDFACFNRLFGYGDGPAPLYSEPQLYPLFPKIASAVAQADYARKLVGLSVNAKWEADQTGALQHATRSVLDAETELFVKLLADVGTDSERSVWAFLFGEPHPSKVPLSATVQSMVCEASSRSCQLSKEVYVRAVSEEHTH
ncbi:MAG: hypothetical protein OES32_09500 [Acidobacteriota bacterium]|nr:hypothetical protein [Acidobacteriota bacterium]